MTARLVELYCKMRGQCSSVIRAQKYNFAGASRGALKLYMSAIRVWKNGGHHLSSDSWNFSVTVNGVIVKISFK